MPELSTLVDEVDVHWNNASKKIELHSDFGARIGGTVRGGATATRVLLVGAGGVLADDAGLTYDASIDQLSTVFLNVGSTAENKGIGGRQLQITGNAPTLIMQNTSAAADNKLWTAFETDTTHIFGRVLNDALTVGNKWYEVTRSGATVSSVAFPSGSVIVGANALTITNAGNLLVGTTAAGATAAKAIALSNAATAPTTSVDLAHVYAEDISAGNCALAVYAEAAASAAVAAPSTHKIPVRYNGTTYYLLASNV